MAEENLIQTNIVANANFASLIGDLNKVSSALTSLQEKLNASNKALATQVSVMNKAFSETLRSTGQFSTHFVSLTSDVDKFGSQLDKGQIKLNQFFKLYQQHTKTSGGIIRELAKQQVQMQNAILQPLGRNAEGLMQYNVHIPRGLDLVANKTKIASQELSIMNRFVQEGAGQLINWGKNTQWAGRQLTVGLTVPMMAFGKAASDAFRTADEQLVRLTKVYGGLAQTSGAELQKVRKDVAATAATLSKQYGSSFQDTLALAADIAATGKQGNELLGSIQETTRLSVLGEVSRQDAMKATLAIQTAFNQNTQQLSESINFLNAVENQTSTTLQDLVEAIPKAGPVIKGLGGSVKDLALYLTAMKEGGISASEGANALKSGLASLINPTKVAQNMFMGFGINLKNIVEKNAGNVTNTILELQGALDKLNPLQKQQALEQLFGKFQFARMNALFSNLGKQGSQTLQVLDLMKASTQDLASVASRELSQVTESASGKYRRAVEGLKADLAGIGDQFLSINTQLIKFVDGVVKFVNMLPDPVKKALSFVGMITAALGPIIMLTGVLGNFFGYIIKGVYHFKAFFKGAEGWKLLTPEILAANKAGALAEQTFYSDAKAASILNQSLQALIASYQALDAKVNAGVISTTVSGAAQVFGAGRQVNPASRYVSEKDTRSMSHLNPVSGMTAEQKINQTMFGVVPGAGLVNAKIGGAPQMYMSGDLQKIEGLSSIKGVSTGVVASEAAKWHTMTAAIAMQSKAELARLKTEIAATGTVTNEVAQVYETLLPKMNDITSNAAKASAVIVEELRLNKITASEARAKVIALNAEVEQMMVATSQEVAAGMGRTINVTQVPMLNQPVIDPKTGKSNMKELLKKGRTRDFVNSIARALGVKTYGASYSTETTIPKKFAQGDIVPGNGNQDTVPAMLTPGEFVVKKSATQQYLPLLKAINGGTQSSGLGFSVGGNVLAYLKNVRGASRPMIAKNLINSIWGNRLTSRAQSAFYEPKGNAGVFGGISINKSGKKFTTSYINKAMEGVGVDPRILLASINNRGGGARLSTDIFLDGLASAGIITKAQKRNLSKQIFNNYAKEIMGMSAVNDYNNPVWSISNRIISNQLSSNQLALDFWNEYSRQPGSFAHPTRRSSTGFLNNITLGNQSVSFKNLEATGANKFYHAKESSNPFIKIINDLIYSGGSFISRNSGGLIPKYANGSLVKAINPQNLAKILESWKKNTKYFPVPSVIKNPKSIAQWPKTPIIDYTNTDPLHGPLFIGKMGSNDVINYNPKNYNQKGNYNIPFSYAFPSGISSDPIERAKHVLNNYMTGYGDPSQMNDPFVKAGLKKLMTPFSGKAFRGISFNRRGQASGGLPAHIEKAIYEAEQTGDYSKLIGKSFIWRSGSWSSNKNIASMYAPTPLNPGEASTLLEVSLRNRNVVNASKIFPNIKFYDKQTSAPGGHGYSENELLFGGAFRIKSASPGKIVLETAQGIEKREKGGNVFSNKPYLVGEKGPELFVPGKNGTIIPHMARGGIIPNLQMRGWWPGTATSQLNYQDGQLLPGKAPYRLPMGSGMMSGMLGSVVGGTVGQAAAGNTGAVIGSLAGSMLPSLILKMGALAKNAGGFLSIITKTGLVLKSLTLPGLVITGIISAAQAMLVWKRHAEDVGKAHRAIMGPTKNSLAEVGLQYTSISDKIKQINDGLKLQREKMLANYASSTGSGVPGLTLTIQQLNDGIKAAKKNAKETVQDFNKLTGKNEVLKLAASLKQQYISAGMSVQAATNTIYTLIKASDKGAYALDAISSKAFIGIKDKATAANYIVSLLASNMSKAGSNSQVLAKGVENMLNSLDAYRQSLIGTKDAQGQVVDATKAQQLTLEKIKGIKGSDAKLNSDTINAIKSQNLELSAVLNTAETLQGVYAKFALLQGGFGTKINISSMSSSEAMTVASGMDQWSKSAGKAIDDTYNLGKTMQTLNDKMIASNKIASAVPKRDYKAEITAIDKLIKKIEQERDARLKALDAQQAAASFATQMQKKQLEYQQALASGNMEAAAQAQLDIQQLTQESQIASAKQALQDQAQAKIDAQNLQKEKIQNAENAAQTVATNAQTAATNYAGQQTAIGNFRATLQSIIGGLTPSTFTGENKKVAVEQLKEALKSLAAGGGQASALAKSYGTDYAATITKLLSSTKTDAATSPFALAVDKFVAAVDKFSYSGSAQSPKSLGKASAINSLLTTSQLKAWNSSYGQNSTRQLIKTLAEDQGLKPGSYFSLSDDAGKVYEFYIRDDGNITLMKNPYKKATGGYISGPGTGTSDSIPAMLSNGEYVVNAMSAAKFGYGNLDKINKMASGGMVSFNIPSNSKLRMANGGQVASIGDTINIDKIEMTFTEVPDNPRQFGREFAAGLSDIKLGNRNRVISTR